MVFQPIPYYFYLSTQTDEPAEQAVQSAIINIEIKNAESNQTDQQKKPPIPISELPPQNQPTISAEKRQKEEIQPI